MSADEEISADSNLSNDSDSFVGSSSKGVVLKKGPWTSAEDAILVDYVKRHGEGNWNSVQKHSGLSRCGKSCRLRWANHLRPNLKKGAFTPEEERLIIELHAKMGNKWARMAAHLPGRTDNEIKNYWNTRIKRRNRAGLPLYPSELCLETQPENQHHLSSPGIYTGDKGYNSIFQPCSYETSGIIFNSPNTLPYPQVFPNISTNGSLITSFASPQIYSFVSKTVQLHKHAQELDEPMLDYKAQNDCYKNKAFQSVNLGFSCDPNHSKILPPNVNQDIRFMSNSLFSASTPFQGAEKLELPSIQYQRSGSGVWDPTPEPWDSLFESPLSVTPSRCDSPRSSGLLEALLYESKDLKKSDNALLDNSVGSVSDGFTHTSAIGSSFEEKTPARHHVKSESIDESWMVDGERQEISDQFDFLRPDAILGSCWLEQSASCTKPQCYNTTGIIEALPFEDLGSDLNLSARTSASDSSWGFNPCSWNNMPPVCQMSEFP